MITLITYPAQFGTRSSSPFCIKAEYLFNMAGVPWQRQDENDPRKWPKAKLPAITVDTDIIGDSDGIRLYLEGQGADFDKNITDIEKAHSHTFIRMAKEHMYFHLVMDRCGLANDPRCLFPGYTEATPLDYHAWIAGQTHERDAGARPWATVASGTDGTLGT